MQGRNATKECLPTGGENGIGVREELPQANCGPIAASASKSVEALAGACPRKRANYAVLGTSVAVWKSLQKRERVGEMGEEETRGKEGGTMNRVHQSNERFIMRCQRCKFRQHWRTVLAFQHGEG